MAEFDFIRITQLNKAACRDLNGKLFEMHLELSAVPPPEWCRFFQDAWEETFHLTNRNVQILDKEILIPSTPDELESQHLFYLKRASRSANERYEGLLNQRQKRYEEQMALREEQKQRLDDIEGRLDFT